MYDTFRMQVMHTTGYIFSYHYSNFLGYIHGSIVDKLKQRTAVNVLG